MCFDYKRFHKSLLSDFLIFLALFSEEYVKSCGCETCFSPINSGPRLGRCCSNGPATDGPGPTIGSFLKVSFGYSERVRVGRTCPTNTQVPARAGGVCGCGRRTAHGSKSGASSYRSWTRKAGLIGVSRSWMAVSPRLKKGRLRRKNQERQRHKVDGGGRRPGCASGKQTGVGQPGGSDPGRADAGEDLRAARWTRPTSQKTLAGRSRQSLRQRRPALALAGTGHHSDQPASARTQKPSLNDGRELRRYRK